MTYEQKRVGRSMAGRGMGTKCHCGKEGVVEEVIMDRRSGYLCGPCAKEAAAVWAGALAERDTVAA